MEDYINKLPTLSGVQSYPQRPEISPKVPQRIIKEYELRKKPKSHLSEENEGIASED